MVSGNFAGGFARGFQSSFGMVSQIRGQREDRELRREALKAKQQETARGLAGERIKARNTEFQNLGTRLGSDPTFAASLTSNRLEDLPPAIREMLEPHIQGQVKDILLANPSLDPAAAQQQVTFSLMNAMGLPAAQTRQKVQEASQIQAAKSAEQLETAGPIARAEAEARAEFAAPQIVFDPTSPTGTRFVGRQEAIGQPGKPPTGLEVVSGPEGLTVRTNVPGAGPGSVSKTTEGRIEKDILDTGELLGRTRDIAESFRPEFLQLGPRVEAAFTAGKEKLGFELDEGDRQGLTEYATFKRRSINNLNLLLNQLSGAAVTEQEFKRLQQGMPNAGRGLFDGDSPTVFKAKVDDVLRESRLAIIRSNLAKRLGVERFSMSLLDVEDRIEREGLLIEAQVKEEQPGLSPELVEAETRARLASMFGLP